MPSIKKKRTELGSPDYKTTFAATRAFFKSKLNQFTTLAEAAKCIPSETPEYYFYQSEIYLHYGIILYLTAYNNFERDEEKINTAKSFIKDAFDLAKKK